VCIHFGDYGPEMLRGGLSDICMMIVSIECKHCVPLLGAIFRLQSALFHCI